MLAKSLRKTGSMREALVTGEEAVAILTRSRHEDLMLFASLETVAMALETLAERPQDKADAAIRAASLLARNKRPEVERGFLASRYAMLRVAAKGMGETGRIRESLLLRKEAIDALETLAGDSPDLRKQLPEQYSLLAVLHGRVGEYAEAATTVEVCAASIAEQGTAGLPAPARSAVAWNMWALARIMTRNDRRPEARRPFALAIDTYRTLCPDPQNSFEPNLASCLNEHAWNLCGLGEQEEALPFAEEAVAVLHPIAETEPGRLASYAAHLDTLATALAMADRRDEALTACQKALDIIRELAEVDSDRYASRLTKMETLQAMITSRQTGRLTER